MNTLSSSLTGLVLLLGLAPAVWPQLNRTHQVKQIDTYVRSVDKFIAPKQRLKIVIADVSSQDSNKPKWRRFASEKALAKFRENSETYTIAFNWKRSGRTVASNFTMFSESGDWAQYVYHYFRPDGSAAMIRTEMRTFMGDYIVIHDRYFDTKGRPISRRSKYLDLTTKKPKKPTAEMLDPNSEFFKADFYKTVAKLPFARLLGGK